MYTWRGGLCHDELHQAKAAHYYHPAPWGSCKPDQALNTPGLSMGNLKAFSALNRDAAKAAAVPTMQQQADVATVDQGSYRSAGRLMHKACYDSNAYDTAFGLSPEDGRLAVTHHAETLFQSTVPLSPAREAAQHAESTIDTSLLSQLLAQSADRYSCSSSTGVHNNASPSMGWSLGTDMQRGVSAASAADDPVNMQEVNDMLSQLPASQMLDGWLGSSNPQLAMQAAAAAPITAAQHSLDSPADAHPLQQQAVAAGSAVVNCSQPLLQQLQLQASMAAQQAALCSSMPANAHGMLLQQYAGAAGNNSPTQQSLLQLLLQQQAAAAPGAEQQLQAMLLAYTAAGSAHAAISHSMPGLANRQQQLPYGTNTAMSSVWPAAAAVDASTCLGSPSVAAVLAQQQQKAMLASLVAEAATLATQQQQSAMLAAAAQGGQYNQLAAQLTACQLATSCPSTFGFLSNSPSNNVIARLGWPSAKPVDPRTTGVQDMVPAAHQQSLFGLAGSGNNVSGKGRRSRASHYSSRANSTGLSIDISNTFGSTASSISSRAASVAGSDFGSADNIAAAAGVSVADLCPSKFEEYWGAADVANSCGSTGSRLASDAASSWPSSSSGAGSLATSPVSSRAESATVESWQSDDEDSAAATTLASLSLNGNSGATGLSKPGNAVSSPSSEQTAVQPAADSIAVAAATAAAKVGGCTVWFPGSREAAGDDAWYLDLPNTCRLFVGNIGSWVDEDMLTAYFGKYGTVVDVQVMWNTKMLARGRRVNREFAFISYSTPLEAARAVHWLDGCRLVDLEKDRNGITVEYENGEGDSKK